VALPVHGHPPGPQHLEDSRMATRCNRAFVIGLDGAMGSAVHEAPTPEIDQMLAEGVRTDSAQTVFPSSSFPAWGHCPMGSGRRGTVLTMGTRVRRMCPGPLFSSWPGRSGPTASWPRSAAGNRSTTRSSSLPARATQSPCPIPNSCTRLRRTSAPTILECSSCSWISSMRLGTSTGMARIGTWNRSPAMMPMWVW
jgi:hypothetical protein